jgi:tetratricopeptide (TPR) repeat protein
MEAEDFEEGSQDFRFEPETVRGWTAAGAYDELFDSLESRTPGLLKRLEEQKTEARRLFDRLMAAEADQRPALAVSEEFRSLRLADLLLEESLELQPEEPLLSEDLAGLAYQVAAQRYEPALASRVDDAKAHACVLIGAARRLAGDRPGAEEAFRRAVVHLTCPPDSLERAFYCQQLAALRRDQGRDDEAAGLLWRAALVYNEGSDLLEEGACLAELGFLFVADDQVYRAVLPLTRACEVLDLHRDASLTVLARLALAVCHARLGEADKAQRVLKTARTMYDRVSDSSRQLAHVTWMEGKVAAFTDNLEDAPGLLETACKAFVRERRLYDAAFAGLDLAAVLAQVGRLESLQFLIEDVVDGFRPDVGQVGVLRVLGTVESALLRGRRAELGDVVASAVKTLRRYRRNPLLVFEGMTRELHPS